MSDPNDTTNDQPHPELWAPRSVDETRKLYDEWATGYDDSMRNWGYATPTRIALALRQSGANPEKPVLDFGCGTGLSGMSLRAVGFELIDGTDISREMLRLSEARGVYRQVWQGQPGDLGHIRAGDYPIIAASGVISLGAAPPETLDLLISALAPGGLLAFNFNDATLAARSYTDRLDIAVLDPTLELVFEEEGPHLPGKNMTSAVYVLRKS